MKKWLVVDKDNKILEQFDDFIEALEWIYQKDITAFIVSSEDWEIDMEG